MNQAPPTSQGNEGQGNKTSFSHSADRHSPDRSDLAEAIILQWSFKPAAMQAMMREVCKLALERGPVGKFSANDLPRFTHGGPGICGAVFGPLAREGVLAPVGRFVDGQFQQDTVKNPGGNHIGVWRLKSAALARALLRAHGQPLPEIKQAEMALASDH